MPCAYSARCAAVHAIGRSHGYCTEPYPRLHHWPHHDRHRPHVQGNRSFSPLDCTRLTVRPMHGRDELLSRAAAFQPQLGEWVSLLASASRFSASEAGVTGC